MTGATYERVVLDTSAQVCFLFAPLQFDATFASLLSKYRAFHTTPYASRELDFVLKGVFAAVTKALKQLPLRDGVEVRKGDLFGSLLDAVPPYIPGGAKLAAIMASRLIDDFLETLRSDGVVPTDATLKAWMEGQYEFATSHASARFEQSEDLEEDLSSCCRWLTQSWSPTCEATGSPGESCRLARLCAERLPAFVESIDAVLDSPHSLDEKNALAQFRDGLRRLPEEESSTDWIVRQITSSPGAFGDLLIYWETPDGSLLVAKDRLFLALREFRASVLPIYLRGLRETGPTEPPERARFVLNVVSRRGPQVVCELVNFTRHQGALLSADAAVVLSKNDRVTFVGERPETLPDEEYLVRRIARGQRLEFAISIRKAPTRKEIRDFGSGR